MKVIFQINDWSIWRTSSEHQNRNIDSLCKRNFYFKSKKVWYFIED